MPLLSQMVTWGLWEARSKTGVNISPQWEVLVLQTSLSCDRESMERLGTMEKVRPHSYQKNWVYLLLGIEPK